MLAWLSRSRSVASPCWPCLEPQPAGGITALALPALPTRRCQPPRRTSCIALARATHPTCRSCRQRRPPRLRWRWPYMRQSALPPCCSSTCGGGRSGQSASMPRVGARTLLVVARRSQLLLCAALAAAPQGPARVAHGLHPRAQTPAAPTACAGTYAAGRGPGRGACPTATGAGLRRC